MTVDKKVWELASQFLQEVEDGQFVEQKPRVHQVGELAEKIQAAIEEWIGEKTIPF